MDRYGYGSKLKCWGSLWFHLPRCHFGTTFLSHSHMQALSQLENPLESYKSGQKLTGEVRNVRGSFSESLVSRNCAHFPIQFTFACPRATMPQVETRTRRQLWASAQSFCLPGVLVSMSDQHVLVCRFAIRPDWMLMLPMQACV